MKRGERANSKKKHKKDQKVRKLMIISGWLLCVAVFFAGAFLVLRISGKYNLQRQAVSYAAETESGAQPVLAVSDEDRDWQEGWIRYEGKDYSYNSDILTFLFMGIDKEEKEDVSGGYPDGGQADALFLLVLNPHDNTMKLIPINRNTMTAVDIYDEQGNRQSTVTAQICIQHGFGDGGKKSCEYQVKAVRRFFYGIPINGYLAVDMDVISEVVGLAGGVDLEVLEDVRNGQREVILRQGEQVHLTGEQAYWYVRDRDSTSQLSADRRLERQRQFLTVFVDRVRQMTRQDVTVPLKIYNGIADRAVTDITADEVIYLATIAGGYHFDAGQIITIPGESISGEENADSDYDEFYADEDAFYKMILDIFYEPVD